MNEQEIKIFYFELYKCILLSLITFYSLDLLYKYLKTKIIKK